MDNFGTVKTKVLHNLTEAYAKGDKKTVQKILKLLKENKEFKELYLFYEEVEKMYIDDKKLAEEYVKNVEQLLKERVKSVQKHTKTINKELKDGDVVEVDLYKNLDVLSEEDTLKNVDKKIFGRKQLIEHLTTKKDLNESTRVYTSNENLLHVVLASKFNEDFEKNLTENEKVELKKLLSISNEELDAEFKSVKEDVNDKVGRLISEENNVELQEKLRSVLQEANRMKPTKYNYHKLQQLRNGL